MCSTCKENLDLDLQSGFRILQKAPNPKKTFLQNCSRAFLLIMRVRTIPLFLRTVQSYSPPPRPAQKKRINKTNKNKTKQNKKRKEK